MAAKYGKMEVASLLLHKRAAPDAAGKVRTKSYVSLLPLLRSSSLSCKLLQMLSFKCDLGLNFTNLFQRSNVVG